MDLNQAFGSAFFLSDSLKLGAAVSPDGSTEESTKVSPEVSPEILPEVSPEPKPKRKVSPPEVYVLRVQIGRDDCHLICMFLLVFAVSFILSSR